MPVYTKVTDQGVVSYEINQGDDVILQPTFSIEIPHVGSGNTVVWAPNYEVTPTGAVRTWAEAVAAVNNMGPVATFIQILANPDEENVEIPGGEWNLNNTTIVGPTPQNPGTDSNYRPDQELLYVYTEGNNSNPCRINGCVGLKNMYFRSQENEVSTYISDYCYTPDSYDTSVIYVNDTTGFRVGQRIQINDYGYYFVSEVVDENTLLIYNDDNDSCSGCSIDGPYTVWADTSVFYVNDRYGKTNEFVLDNVDFHFGNYRWGTFHIDYDGEVAFKLVNGTSIRWYCIRCDNYATVRMGDYTWVGNYTFNGNGYIDLYMGVNSRNNSRYTNYNWSQDCDMSLYQSRIEYIANDYTDWGSGDGNGQPLTITEAIDRIAEQLRQLSHRP